ncbi:hypothetical protein [uncultured Flavonifractor sp.]|uniref:hypothetical protein n=1 Tax=uncultured Flavonifractor sp. TaxID=1193534 RepID=UPI0026361B17|nr:hypothetical protein [uncultured Flavonifractor sp.]
MTAQDCPNCHYPAPNRKQDQEKKQAPQSPYHIPEPEKVEECAQCFYQPEEQDQEKQKEDDCNQCFYRPEK